MYIRSYDGWEQERLPFSYRNPGLADALEKVTQLSLQIVNKLADLVFFSRHPELKGKAFQDNRTFAGEWSKIKNQLLKPAAGNSSGFIIDLTLPKSDPQPDFSKTEDELGVWEWAIISGKLSFKCGTEETVAPRGKPGSYVSSVSLKFDKPQFTIFIAKHLRDNAFNQAKSRAERYAWHKTLLPIQEHAYVHLKLFRRAAQDLENVLRGLFSQLLTLPTVQRPLAVSKQRLDSYLNSLGEFLTAIVQLELWEKTCGWEKEDYPELTRKINRAGAVFIAAGLKVKCAPRPDLPDVPVPPAAIRPRSDE
jgi:hypothetical protein